MEQVKEIVKNIVEKGAGIFDMTNELEKKGFKNIAFVHLPFPILTFTKEGKRMAILNKKYAEKPEAEIGQFAIGYLS